MMLSTIRPDAWNVPLLLHVAGAMLLVGSLVVVVVVMGGALRGGVGAAMLTRLGLRTLLFGVLPGYVLMRASAEWIASKEHLGDPAWLGIGYIVADGGLVLAVVATVVAWRANRRPDGPGGLGRAVVALAALLLLAYALAIWAMTTKPS
jgi:hypothetical protein